MKVTGKSGNLILSQERLALARSGKLKTFVTDNHTIKFFRAGIRASFLFSKYFTVSNYFVPHIVVLARYRFCHILMQIS